MVASASALSDADDASDHDLTRPELRREVQACSAAARAPLWWLRSGWYPLFSGLTTRACAKATHTSKISRVGAGAIGAAFMLMRTDVRDSSRMLQRNMKTIRTWLEESQSAASTCVFYTPGPPPMFASTPTCILAASCSSVLEVRMHQCQRSNTYPLT